MSHLGTLACLDENTRSKPLIIKLAPKTNRTILGTWLSLLKNSDIVEGNATNKAPNNKQLLALRSSILDKRFN